MKKTLQIFFFLTVTIISAAAFANGSRVVTRQTQNPWHLMIGIGHAWSTKAGIKNPDPSIWDPATEGYNSTLKNAPLYSIGMGRNITPWVDVNITYRYAGEFNYHKRQTSNLAPTPGFTGTIRDRFFDVTSQALLVNGTIFLGQLTSTLRLPLGHIYIQPFLGAGIGAAWNTLKNFHTITFLGGTSALIKANTTSDFAWQASAGLNIQTTSRVGFNVGYRYFDAGNIKTGTKFFSTTSGRIGTTKAFKGTLATHEVFADIIVSL